MTRMTIRAAARPAHSPARSPALRARAEAIRLSIMTRTADRRK